MHIFRNTHEAMYARTSIIVSARKTTCICSKDLDAFMLLTLFRQFHNKFSALPNEHLMWNFERASDFALMTPKMTRKFRLSKIYLVIWLFPSTE